MNSILLYRLNFNSPQNHDSWVFIPFECHVIYKILRTIRHLTGVCNFRESFGIQNKYSFTLNVTLWISKNSFCCGTCRFSKLFMTGTWNYIVVCLPVVAVYCLWQVPGISGSSGHGGRLGVYPRVAPGGRVGGHTLQETGQCKSSTQHWPYNSYTTALWLRFNASRPMLNVCKVMN